MSVLRSSLLAAALLLAAAPPLHATEIVVDGEAGCLAVGGQMSHGASCTVAGRLVVPAGTRVVLERGFSLTVGGATIIDGILETNGRFDPGQLTNRGTLITRGMTVNTGLLVNEATWLNQGWLHPHSDVNNRGHFVNDGLFETCTGSFRNHGFWHNRWAFANWGWGVWNHGIAVNDGRYYNPDGDSYRFNNLGAFENNGTFENWGIADGWCGSVWHGEGDVIGIPLEDSWCAPAVAIVTPIDVVLGLDPAHDNVLTKDETVALWSLLARASKRLAVHNAPEAEAILRLFIREVETLASSGLAPHISHALIAWASRILELMEL